MCSRGDEGNEGTLVARVIAGALVTTATDANNSGTKTGQNCNNNSGRKRRGGAHEVVRKRRTWAMIRKATMMRV